LYIDPIDRSDRLAVLDGEADDLREMSAAKLGA
jgi:hypothetical protein